MLLTNKHHVLYLACEEMLNLSQDASISILKDEMPFSILLKMRLMITWT